MIISTVTVYKNMMDNKRKNFGFSEFHACPLNRKSINSTYFSKKAIRSVDAAGLNINNKDMSQFKE